VNLIKKTLFWVMLVVLLALSVFANLWLLNAPESLAEDSEITLTPPR